MDGKILKFLYQRVEKLINKQFRHKNQCRERPMPYYFMKRLKYLFEKITELMKTKALVIRKYSIPMKFTNN